MTIAKTTLDPRADDAGQTDCDALFDEILRNDRIDLSGQLPETIDLDFDQDLFRSSFALSRSLWRDRLDRRAFVDIARTLEKEGTIGPDERLRFKHERARYKHLRFAFSMFGRRHRYPLLFDAVTSVMGNLQDAFKNDKPVSVRRNATLLRLLLSPVPFDLVMRETGRFRATTPERFRRYLRSQVSDIARFLEHRRITAQEFHDTRKIVSRCRACFATITTVAPDPNNIAVAAYLATINGLMGGFHDDLMTDHLNGALDYRRDLFILQDEIRQRLQMLVSAVH